MDYLSENHAGAPGAAGRVGRGGVIGRCAKGEYFGEIALLTDRRRACTVKAVGPTKVLSLQRKTFTRVMGPLQELLKRNGGTCSRDVKY